VTEYEFTLRYSHPDSGVPTDRRLERLAEEGCDDALAGIGHSGRIALAFSREAGSAREAVLGAIADVRRAMPDARLIEAAPDLVGLTDVADTMGFSRQNMRKLMFGRSDAPAPVHDSKPSLWHLAHVLEWLRTDRGYNVPPALLELSTVTMQVNLAAEGAHLDRGIQREIRAVLH